VSARARSKLLAPHEMGHHLVQGPGLQNREPLHHRGFGSVFRGHHRCALRPFLAWRPPPWAAPRAPAGCPVQGQLAHHRAAQQRSRGNTPDAARMPRAMGRSKPAPSLRTPAGARFTVMRFKGNKARSWPGRSAPGPWIRAPHRPAAPRC
jgi:hypothetical protein